MTIRWLPGVIYFVLLKEIKHINCFTKYVSDSPRKGTSFSFSFAIPPLVITNVKIEAQISLFKILAVLPQLTLTSRLSMNRSRNQYRIPKLHCIIGDI